MLEQFGINEHELPDAGYVALPDEVPGRELQLDADFLCYHATYDEDVPFEQCISNYKAEAEKYRVLAGAETVFHHLTHRESVKGNRYSIAIQKPYQEQRGDKPKPLHLHALREWIADNLTGENYKDIEADDGICLRQQAAIERGERHLSVIWSGDKDLTMMEGLHLDNKTLLIIDAVGYGSCKLDTSGSTTKVKGYGTSFFWHQMLMGDTADNIQGLKHITGDLLNEYFPTKAVLAASGNASKLAAIAAKRNPQPCGPAKAYTILDGASCDREAAQRVIKCYRAAYGNDWLDIFRSEAMLLWMRRYSKSERDVVEWINKEVLA